MLLIHVAPAPVAFASAGSYFIQIPSANSWTGTVLLFQGLRLDVVVGTPTFVLLNAMELVVGL